MNSIWVVRKRLDHWVPGWAQAPEFFITICAQERGRNHFCQPMVAKCFFDSALHLFKLRSWDCELLLLMPDHLHLLVSFSARKEMGQVITRWKRWVAWKAGLIFQTGFFDHRLRSTASGCEKWAYIHFNPVRAGLVQDPIDWPFRWTRKDFEVNSRSACKADPT